MNNGVSNEKKIEIQVDFSKKLHSQLQDDYNNFCTNSPLPDDALIIKQSQISSLVGIFIIIIVGCFVLGYFIGHATLFDNYLKEFKQTSFAEKIQHSIVTHSIDNRARQWWQINEPVLPSDLSDDEINTNFDAGDNSLPLPPSHPTREYYAQLISYHTQEQAQVFAKKCASLGIETRINKRASKSQKGKNYYWYQVSTIPSSSLSFIQESIQKLKRVVPLEGVAIMMKSDGKDMPQSVT